MEGIYRLQFLFFSQQAVAAVWAHQARSVSTSVPCIRETGSEWHEMSMSGIWMRQTTQKWLNAAR